MSKPNPVIERIKAHRALLETGIVAAAGAVDQAKAKLASLQAEAAVLDKLMAPPPAAEKPTEKKPRATRKVDVTGHQRTIGATDPGATLPIEDKAAA